MTSTEQQTILLQGAAVWNRWRRENPAVASNLDDLRLTLCAKQWSATNADPIDFSKVSLRRADFRFATLERADLRGADLHGADFYRARLNGANFAEARLSGAQFAETDLADALLSKADVRGANFSGARNFTFQQLKDTVGDATTVLPDGVLRPDNWEKQCPDAGEAKPQRRAPTKSRFTRSALAVCASLVVALGLISAVVIDPAPPSRAASSQSAPQPPAVSAVVVRSASAMPRTSRALRAGRRRTMGVSLTVVPTSVKRMEFNVDAISEQVQLREGGVLLALRDGGPPEASRPLEAAPLAINKSAIVDVAAASFRTDEISRNAVDASHKEGAPSPPLARAQVQLSEDGGLLALRDKGPPETTRLFDAAAPPIPEPVAIVVAARVPSEAIRRDASVDTNLPLPREGASDDPLLAYLNAPEGSDRWIGGLVERFYLSGMALNNPRVLSVYAPKVNYFGSLTPATEVARQKAAYYARWPIRSYALIPGSLAVKWTSTNRAEVVFSYRYRVASSKAHRAGRGRAILEVDFSQRPARIAKEDGKLLGSAPRG